MAAYYNEWNRQKAAWLRQLIADKLIADGEVDERDIRAVDPRDLRNFTQCHWFAGIGGWSYALRLAGWPDDRPVWTGSCPCQSLSSATRGRLTAEDLAPAFIGQILASRPAVVLGEQVADAGWMDRLCDALEAVGYGVWASVLPACSIGADHLRPRVYFACHTDRHRQPGRPIHAEASRLPRTRGDADRVVSADGLSRDVVALAGFGDAIVPGLAAQFIQAYCEAREGVTP